MHSYTHGPRRLNFLEHRAVETEPTLSSASVVAPSPSATNQTVVTNPPLSTATLAAIISAVGVLVILGWSFHTQPL